MGDEKAPERLDVEMGAQVNVTQARVLTREDELRLFALQTATRDRFHFDKNSAEPSHVRALADAQAYYEWLCGGVG